MLIQVYHNGRHNILTEHPKNSEEDDMLLSHCLDSVRKSRCYNSRNQINDSPTNRFFIKHMLCCHGVNQHIITFESLNNE